MADSNTLISTGEDTFTVHAPGTYIVTASDGKRTAKGTAIIRENGETVYLSLAFSVAVPTAGASPVYSGEEQEGNFNGADWDIMEAEGVSATDAGEYEATFRLNEPEYYAWDDGEDGDERYVTWKIEKATPGAPVLSEYSVSIGEGDDTANVTAEWEGDGELMAYSTDPDVADVYVDYDTIIITYNSDGAASIVVGIAEGDNFKAYEGNGAVINVNAGVDMVATIIVITDTGNSVTLSGPDGVRTDPADRERAVFPVTSTGTYRVTVMQGERQKTAIVVIDEPDQTETVTLWMEQVYLTVLSGISGTLTVKNSAGAVVYTGETEGESTVTLHGIDTYTATVVDEDGDKQSGTAEFVRDEQSITLTLEDVVEVMRLTIPTQLGTLTYDDSGITQVASFNNYDEDLMDIDGEFEGTEVRTYEAVFSLKDTENYVWEDGTTEDKTVEWKIDPAEGSVALNPSVLAVEPGSVATISVTRNSTGAIRAVSSDNRVATVRVSGGDVIVTGVAEGDVVITVTVDKDDNHTAASTTCVAEVVTESAELEIKATATSYSGAYDKAAHSIMVNVTQPASGYTIRYSADNATWSTEKPTFTNVTSSARRVYYWITADGYQQLTGSATVTITRAVSTITISPTEMTLSDSAMSGTIAITYNGDGKLSASSSNESVAKVSLDGAIATVTKAGAGNATITISASAGTNYSAPSSKTCAVTVEARVESTAYITFSSPSKFTVSLSRTASLGGILYYSTDGTTWVEWNRDEGSPWIYPAISSSTKSGTKYLYLRGSGITVFSGTNQQVFYFTGSNIYCSGNIETLLDYETVEAGGHPEMGEGCFYDLFANCSALKTPPELPAGTLTERCYTGMFINCTGLTKAPELNADVLARSCYEAMFSGCTSLVSPPSLPARTLAKACYAIMFFQCVSLTKLPKLPATVLSEECYLGMFDGCTKIKLSETLTGSYKNEFRISARDAQDAMDNMFANTGGTFTSTPTINTTYYTTNPLVPAT